MFTFKSLKNLSSKVLLWIRIRIWIRIGSGFNDCVDPDRAKLLDPDPCHEIFDPRFFH
jgi:hypothetical protein